MFYICFCRIFANTVSILYYSITSAEEHKLFLPAISVQSSWNSDQPVRKEDATDTLGFMKDILT